MIEKRLFLAISLSLIIVIGWSYWVSHFYLIEKQRVTILKNPEILLDSSPVYLSEEEEFLWKNNLLYFDSSQASLKKIIFKDYQNETFFLEKGLLFDLKERSWQREQKENWLGFNYEDDKKRIKKEFIFSNINNSIYLKIKIQNLLSQNQRIDFNLLSNELNFDELNSPQGRFYEVVFKSKGGEKRLSPRKEYIIEKLELLSFRNRYFCLIIEPEVKEFQGFIHKINNSKIQIGLTNSFILAPRETKELNFLVYIGPQDLSQVSKIKEDWSTIINYGILSPIVYGILWLLNLFYKLFHNWGLAIISLSIFIYFLLYPLNLKQLISMKKIQALQPRIEELKKLYSQNPQRLNKEILELYRKEKINPASGCLPLFLQIPIFFALYQGLIRSIDLKGKSFLWIRDLAEPERIVILGKQINLLPILLVILMFLQSRRSQMVSSIQSEQQKIFSLIFPLILGIVFYSLPSGLVLYWIINSGLMYIFQSKTKF